jgi:tetratricopeptide (TPR) repeat protein
MGTLERILTFVWHRPYVLPWAVYWLAVPGLVLAVLLIPVKGIGLLFLLGLISAAVVGIVRWIIERRRCRWSLVVARFEEGAGTRGRGREVQNLIVADLRASLPEPLRGFVQPISLTIADGQDELASRVRRRLKAQWVVHGRVQGRPDGRWSVYPRILEAATTDTQHVDHFTGDVTPANVRFGPILTSLPEQLGVRDEAFPLDFCRDLEAVVRGIDGIVAEAFGAHERGLELLDGALAVAGESTNHEIDQLRVSRAKAMWRLDRQDAAIDYLRERLSLPDPSPELLRTLARFLFFRSNDLAEAGRHDEATRVSAEEMIVLRRALAYEGDPQRDMTRYNILTHLRVTDPADQPEFDEILQHLLRSPTLYRRQWYVKLAAAQRAWTRVDQALADTDEAALRHWGAIAAKWYGRTLRARPKIQILAFFWRPPFIAYKRFQRSAILYANAVDANRYARNRWRLYWYERRFQRIRLRRLNQGKEWMLKGDWQAAHAYFDWAVVGRRDPREAYALTYSACMWWKSGENDKGMVEWARAKERGPDALYARRQLVGQLEEAGLDPDVPGDEPLDERGIEELVERDYPDWVCVSGWGWYLPAEWGEGA